MGDAYTIHTALLNQKILYNSNIPTAIPVLAQLVEREVFTLDVVGSIPTYNLCGCCSLGFPSGQRGGT